MHYISYIGPVWTASPALDPQNLDSNLKKSLPNTFSSTSGSASSNRWIYPQIHQIGGSPQGVLHQIKLWWSWEKLPTTVTDYTKIMIPFVLFNISSSVSKNMKQNSKLEVWHQDSCVQFNTNGGWEYVFRWQCHKSVLYTGRYNDFQ
jgi:hypothetical protein